MPIVGADEVARVIAAIRAGEVAAIPTDTVYGLAADAADPRAVARIAEHKGRPEEQPIAVLIDDPDALRGQVEDGDALAVAARYWPGALTVVVRARHGFARAVVTPAGTVGLRQPDDALARRVIRECGGVLAVSSANRAGNPPALSAEEVAATFGDDLLVLDGGPRPGGVASTVVDLTVDPPEVLRRGPVDPAALLAREPAS